MNKVPDRAKMRREYLWKKWTLGTGLTMAGAAVVIGLPGCFAALLFHPIDMWGFSALLLAGIATIGGYRGCCLAKEASEIPYVPPVHKQIATLPAQEILLRGSQESPASPEELLRPAGRHETKAEELMRAASVDMQE